MDQVILMCGMAGSGKSTYARGLEARGYEVLSFDRIAWELGFRDHPLADDARAEVHACLRKSLLAVVARGELAVVDSSFRSRTQRDAYRELLAEHGIVPAVHYLDTPRETILARLAARGNRSADDIAVPAATAAAYLEGFEVPTEEEGPLRIVMSS
ncbi:AAA family ATPase [Demequina subtropica]|uniref:AAA family ATPase n=1 Tax=Demequina subtropica TaxID=1638989 RepID=UPI000A7F85B2|nr:ATP-binding protein [Demequina subtropica]